MSEIYGCLVISDGMSVWGQRLTQSVVESCADEFETVYGERRGYSGRLSDGGRRQAGENTDRASAVGGRSEHARYVMGCMI